MKSREHSSPPVAAACSAAAILLLLLPLIGHVQCDGSAAAATGGEHTDGPAGVAGAGGSQLQADTDASSAAAATATATKAEGVYDGAADGGGSAASAFSTGADANATGSSDSSQSTAGMLPLQQQGSYTSDAAMWVWPTANDPNAENLIHSILYSWCSDTYVDAVKDASDKAALFDRLRAERDQRYTDSMRCNQERSIRERELEMECERARQLQASSFEREREKLRGDCETESSHLKSELENCDIKLKKKAVVGGCQREVATERAACEAAKRSLQAELSACQQTARMANVSRTVQLEETAVHATEDRALWAAQRKVLLAEVGECRPARARAQKRLSEVLSDSKVGSLETTVMWLQFTLLNLLLLLGVAAGFIAYQSLRESPGSVEGGHGWISMMPPSRLKLVDAETAREQLVDAFEGRKGSRLAIVLAQDLFYGRGSGPNMVYLLVPINITSSRRFMLFNADGGDYTAHVERAREIVAKADPDARLLVVLYEAGGCVFTEATLQSLRLTADKVAHEAIPEDMDFPKAHNLVVLWLDKQEGLRASDSAHESDLTDDIKSQPWTQYLLMRSGRWGQVHAQFM